MSGSTTPSSEAIAAASKRNDSIASSARPTPATTPYLRPSGSRRGKSSKTDLRSAVPDWRAACTMVSS